jgi:GTPase Era involved in 16S rRNA processing
MAELGGALSLRGHRAGERGKGRALDALLTEVRRLLPVAPAIYGPDEITDRDERFLAAEFVREKIFRLLGEECRTRRR